MHGGFLDVATENLEIIIFTLTLSYLMMTCVCMYIHSMESIILL